MDREILFRAKHIHTASQNEYLDNIWIEGYLSDKNRINSSKLGGELLVDEKTVCQYTGLLDRNGVKIFEGDILQGKSKRAYVVQYSDDIAGFVARGTGVSLTPCMNCGTMRCYAVVGNVFDDPGLMEVDGDEKV